MPTLNYTNEEDFNDYIPERIQGELTNDEDGSVARTKMIKRALSNAEDFVDGYLAEQVSTPVSNPKNHILDAVYKIARYNLYKRRPGGVTEQVRMDYEDVVSWLKDVARGRVTIDTANTEGDQTDARSGFGDNDDTKFGPEFTFS